MQQEKEGYKKRAGNPLKIHGWEEFSATQQRGNYRQWGEKK